MTHAIVSILAAYLVGILAASLTHGLLTLNWRQAWVDYRLSIVVVTLIFAAGLIAS